jgi:hypothetical protein
VLAAVAGVSAGLIVNGAGTSRGRSETSSVGTVDGPVGAAASSPPARAPATGRATASPAAGSAPAPGASGVSGAAGHTGSSGGAAAVAGDRPRGSTPGATAPAGPALTLTASTVDLGSAQTTGTTQLAARGANLAFTVGAPPSWLTVSPLAGTVPAGQTEEVVVTIDRSSAPVGAVAVNLPVTVRGGAGGGTLTVRATVAAGPAIGTPTLTPSTVYAAGCGAGAPVRPTLDVSVVDAVGLFGVSARTTAPDGSTASTDLTLGQASGSRSDWSGALPASARAGQVALDIVVTGLDGRESHRAGGYPVVTGCPADSAGVITPPG